ncbi:hypothetical protein Q4595_29450, partial [Wenyingzhuangia sp. 1_MG-2023]|nr:hypothetical protein [Wenyingzhuangia sp. 1_MG-2023]
IQYLDRTVYPDVEVGDYALQYNFNNYNLYVDGSTLVDIGNTSNTNPADKILERERYDDKFKLFVSVYTCYNITDDLSFKTT